MNSVFASHDFIQRFPDTNLSLNDLTHCLSVKLKVSIILYTFYIFSIRLISLAQRLSRRLLSQCMVTEILFKFGQIYQRICSESLYFWLYFQFNCLSSKWKKTVSQNYSVINRNTTAQSVTIYLFPFQSLSRRLSAFVYCPVINGNLFSILNAYLC